jgi:hypothetical protein
LPQSLVKAEAAREVASAGTLQAEMVALAADANRIRERAEHSGDLKTALQGLREVVRLLELKARITGELASAQVSVTVNTQINELTAELAGYRERDKREVDHLFEWLTADEIGGYREALDVGVYLQNLAAEREARGVPLDTRPNAGREYHDCPHREGAVPWLQVGKGDAAHPYFCDLLTSARGV